MSDMLIEVKNVEKDFGTKTIVLEDINLEIHEGEFVAILGPSGSGKSTLLRIIAGLLPASQGSIQYLGTSFEGVNPGVAMVFQSFALFPWLTVFDNILQGMESSKLPDAKKHEKAQKAIDMVGLDGFETAYPKELSGGMRQRVGLGRALVNDPAVLLMDEPFSALDVLTAENLRRDVLKLWLDKNIPTKTIIMVTHGIEEAVFMADRVIILSTGPAKIVKDMPVDIPRWRDRKSPEFLEMVDNIYNIMMHKDAAVVASTDVHEKKFVALPLVSVGALTGFLELLEDVNTKTDIYKLADRFGMDIKNLFPIIQAASLLGMINVVDGDIEMTPEGLKYGHASANERKAIFKKQFLSNVPFISHILAVIQSKTTKRMNIEFFEQIVGDSMGRTAAQKQLEVFLNWGRYAELLKYDRHHKQVYL